MCCLPGRQIPKTGQMVSSASLWKRWQPLYRYNEEEEKKDV